MKAFTKRVIESTRQHKNISIKSHPQHTENDTLSELNKYYRKWNDPTGVLRCVKCNDQVIDSSDYKSWHAAFNCGRKQLDRSINRKRKLIKSNIVLEFNIFMNDKQSLEKVE